MSTRKRKVEEEDDDEADDKNGASSPEKMISPDGMKLRSGRKKRRKRSSEGISGECPSEKKKGTTEQRMEEEEKKGPNGDENEAAEESSSESSSLENDEDDDQSMSQSGDEERVQDRKVAAIPESQQPAPSNGTHHAVAAPSKQLPRVAKLKLPSQHTPGRKINETARLRDKGTVPQPSMRLVLDDASNSEKDHALESAPQRRPQQQPAVQQQQQHEEIEDLYLQQPEQQQGENLIHQLVRKLSEGLAIVRNCVQQLIVPQHATQEEEEVVEEDENPQRQNNKHLQKTWVWLLLILLIAYTLGLLTHPFLSSAGNLANVALPAYKSVFSAAPVPDNERLQLAEQQATQRTKELVDRSNRLLSELSAAGKSLFRDLSALEIESTKLSADPQLKSTIQAVQAILSQGEETISPRMLQDIQTALGDASGYILNLGALTVRNSPFEQSGCAALQRSDVMRAVKDVKLKISRETDAIKADGDVVDAVVEWALANAGDRFVPPAVVADEGTTSTAHGTGSSLESVRKMIHARLELEKADRTGQVDYAAIYNGAQVISWGEHATSPSLVENLPFLNRMARALGLRFYGHGPEAALTPTFPPEALGQCWSFERQGSPYATFSIRLALPLYVTSVSIEHPPREVTDRVKSAIRQFRVAGFESADGTGRAWDLGSFEYKIGGQIIQDFEVEEDGDEGDDLPPFRSITVSIDSTWGLQYACLYRLRVHGVEAGK